MKNTLRSLAVRLFYRPSQLLGIKLPERLFKHLHFVGPFRMGLPNGVSLQLYSWGNRVENELAWRGWDGHETRERQCWVKLLQNGSDIFDVGANTGTFAMTAKALAPDSNVIAFEPLVRIANKAKKNVGISGVDVRVENCAVSNTSGTAKIHDPGGANAYSASLDPDFLSGTKQTYDVPVVSIDDYCDSHALEPLLVKLDVEGFEGQVLCGAEKVLTIGKCVFLCEWLGSKGAHESAIRLLKEKRYIALDIEDLNEIDLRDSIGFDERNIVLVHQSREEEVKKLLSN